MKKYFTILLAIAFGVILISCGSSSSDQTDQDETTTGLQFDSVADFSSSASAALSLFLNKTTTGLCSDLQEPIEMEDASSTDGLDCDVDGGVAAHITPTKYSLAFKSVRLVTESGEGIDLIPDTGTLANSQVVNFTPDDPSESVVAIDPEDMVAGTYVGMEFEIYYFQLTFPVSGVVKNVRIYMSDDDFAAEGNLGHHQGDITLVDDNGVELGWIDNTWLDVADNRAGQGGAGGADPETNHERGFFGNEDQWNAEGQMQGSGQDVFSYNVVFSLPIPIPEPASITDLYTVTATFSVADTFFYENFDNPTLEECTGFCPEEGGDANLANAEWAPLAPTAELSAETSSGL